VTASAGWFDRRHPRSRYTQPLTLYGAKFRSIALPALGLLACLTTTGCLRRTRIVQKVVRPASVRTATLDELLAQINHQDDQIQSLSLAVTITASVGGANVGKVTDYTSLSGFILLQKPDKLRVLGLVPVLHNKAFDMASNGDTFKLLIPAKGKLITGSNKIEKPSPVALENLRPYVFTQSLLIAAVPAADFTYMAAENHFDTDPKNHNLVEKLDYDIGVLHRKDETNQLLPRRIIHISRVDLIPYQQDLYDDQGAIETQAFYSGYRDFNGVQFPATIRILRPQEEYEITLTVEKLTENPKLGADQFELAAPPGIQIQALP